MALLKKTKKYKDGKLQIVKQSKSSYQGKIYLGYKHKPPYAYHSVKTAHLVDAVKTLSDWYDDINYKRRHNQPIAAPKTNTFISMSQYYIDNFNWQNNPTHKDDGKYHEHITKWIKDEKIVKVNTASMKRLRDEYLPKITSSKNTIKHWFTYIRRVYNFHLENELISKNDVPDFPQMKSESGRRVFLNFAEYRTLITKSIERMNEPNLNRMTQLVRLALNRYIIFMCATGLRSGEGYNLKWDNIKAKINTKTKERFLSIEVIDGKTGNRTVVSKPPAVSALQELKPIYLEYQDVFRKMKWDKEKVFPFLFEKSFRNLLKSCDLYIDKSINKKRDAYVTRHTYISWAVIKGESLTSIARNCGNHPSTIDKHYVNFLNATHFEDTLSSLEIIK